MSKLFVIAALLLVAGATAQCPAEYPTCGTTTCRNAKIVCTPSGPPSCAGLCGPQQADDGCGGKVNFQCCPCSCTVAGINGLDGKPIVGVCSTTSVKDTVPAGFGSCPSDGSCGKCYLPSDQLCKASTNGPCAKAGAKCGCYITDKGANCDAGNFLFPYISPSDPSIIGNGAGCEENVCNAAAQKNDPPYNAACCPVNCKK